jgi:hypothetical protein
VGWVQEGVSRFGVVVVTWMCVSVRVHLICEGQV